MPFLSVCIHHWCQRVKTSPFFQARAFLAKTWENFLKICFVTQDKKIISFSWGDKKIYCENVRKIKITCWVIFCFSDVVVRPKKRTENSNFRTGRPGSSRPGLKCSGPSPKNLGPAWPKPAPTRTVPGPFPPLLMPCLHFLKVTNNFA